MLSIEAKDWFKLSPKGGLSVWGKMNDLREKGLFNYKEKSDEDGDWVTVPNHEHRNPWQGWNIENTASKDDWDADFQAEN